MEKNNCTQVQINYEIFCKTKRTFLSEPFSELPEPFLNRANYGRHKKSVLRALLFLSKKNPTSTFKKWGFFGRKKGSLISLKILSDEA